MKNNHCAEYLFSINKIYQYSEKCFRANVDKISIKADSEILQEPHF